MSNLKNGDLIMIKYNGEEVKAKFLKTNADGSKLNVLAKGKLTWIPVSDHIGMAEPLDLSKKKDDKVVGSADAKKDSRESKGAKKDSRESKKIESSELAEQGQEPSTEVEAGQNKGGGESSSNEKEISLTKHQAAVLDFLISKGEGGSENPYEISVETGLLVPQIEKAAEGLVKAGLILRSESKETGVILSLTQKGFTMKTAAKKSATKNRAAVKKMKPAAKGDAVVSKRDQVIALLKDKSLTINDIAEKLDTDPNYVREIKTSISKKIEEPESGSTKAKIWKMLKDGKSVKEVAEKMEKSSVYVYKIQKQMVSSGHL